jgi:hypothetical protein
VNGDGFRLKIGRQPCANAAAFSTLHRVGHPPVFLWMCVDALNASRCALLYAASVRPTSEWHLLLPQASSSFSTLVDLHDTCLRHILEVETCVVGISFRSAGPSALVPDDAFPASARLSPEMPCPSAGYANSTLLRCHCRVPHKVWKVLPGASTPVSLHTLVQHLV